jgi:murein DD-endopeptidase MepM/ murein hydrolase activator NlpD
MRGRIPLAGLCSAALVTGALVATSTTASAAPTQHSTVSASVPAAQIAAIPAAKDKPGKKKAGTSKSGSSKPTKTKQSQGSKKSAKNAAKQKSAKKAAAQKKAAKRAAAKRAAAQRAAAKRQALAYKKAKARVKGITAPRMINGRICPTRNFSYGDGWGADRGRRNHAGMDMSGRRGTPLFAIESGRIDRTKRQSNGALQIVMKGRSGSKYYYGHMQYVFVRGGQSVRAGQVIGTMGDSGSPGAVHLHFEYWKSGRESAAVNPASLLRTICRSAQ